MSRSHALPLDERTEIEELLYRYCDLVDRAEIAAIASLFTADGVIDYGHGHKIEGSSELLAFFTDRLQTYDATSHHCSNVIVDAPEPGAAVDFAVDVRSSIYAWHQLPDGSQVEIWGRYLDVVVREDDGWRIRSRAIRAAGWRGFSVPDGQPGPFEMIDRAVIA